MTAPADVNPSWPFPDEACYRARLQRIQQRMRAASFDILVCTGSDLRRYLGGVDGLVSTRPICLLIPAEGDACFISPRLETAEIRAQSWIPVTAEWLEWEDGEGT